MRYERPNSKNCDATFSNIKKYEFFGVGKKFCTEYIYVTIKCIEKLIMNMNFKFLTKVEINLRNLMKQDAPLTVREKLEHNLLMIRTDKNFRETFTNEIDRIRKKKAMIELDLKKSCRNHLTNNREQAFSFRETRLKAIEESAERMTEMQFQAIHKKRSEDSLIKARKLINIERLKIKCDRVHCLSEYYA